MRWADGTFLSVGGKVDSKMPSAFTPSGLLLLNTGILSSLPGNGKTNWDWTTS